MDRTDATTFGLYAEVTVPGSGRNWQHTLTKTRSMTVDEYESVGSARKMLAQAGNHSEYSNVRDYRDDLMKSVTEQISALIADRNVAQRLFPQTSRRFADYLGAFKGFGERTSTWLSHAYGRDSEPMTRFRAAAAREFDSNAAYRVMHGLRNISAHGAQVINHPHISAQLLPDGGSYEELLLGVDGPALVTEYKSRLRAATAAEMRAAPQDFDVIKLVELTLQSCARIHANVFDSVKPDFLSALNLLEGLWNDAADAATTEVWAMVDYRRVGNPSFDGMLRVRDFMFDSAAALPSQWQRILDAGVPEVTLDQVCEKSELRVYKNADGSFRPSG